MNEDTNTDDAGAREDRPRWHDVRWVRVCVASILVASVLMFFARFDREISAATGAGRVTMRIFGIAVMQSENSAERGYLKATFGIDVAPEWPAAGSFRWFEKVNEPQPIHLFYLSWVKQQGRPGLAPTAHMRKVMTEVFARADKRITREDWLRMKRGSDAATAQ